MFPYEVAPNSANPLYVYGAISYDVDGTLVLSEPTHRLGLDQVCAKYGVTLCDEHFEKPQAFSIETGAGTSKKVNIPLFGLSHHDIYYWLRAQHERSTNQEALAQLSCEQFCEELQEAYKKNQKSIIVRADSNGYSTRDMICHLSEFGFMQGIVTSSRSRLTKVNLKALGLPISEASPLTTQVVAEDVKRTKPDPAPYLLSKQRISQRLAMVHQNLTGDTHGLSNVVPVHIAVEDSLHGVEAARRAGFDRVIYFPDASVPFSKIPQMPASCVVARSVSEVERKIKGAMNSLCQRIAQDPYLTQASMSNRRVSNGINLG